MTHKLLKMCTANLGCIISGTFHISEQRSQILPCAVTFLVFVFFYDHKKKRHNRLRLTGLELKLIISTSEFTGKSSYGIWIDLSLIFFLIHIIHVAQKSWIQLKKKMFLHAIQSQLLFKQLLLWILAIFINLKRNITFITDVQTMQM